MELVVLGCVSFLLFFLGDVNDAWLGKSVLKNCFPAGATLLVAATLAALILNDSAGYERAFQLKLATSGLGLVFLGLTLHALFIALPGKQSYRCPGSQRAVCDSGVYALCRHPGVLWFGLLYLCLVTAVNLPWAFALTCIGLNILLALFEDRVVFPRLMPRYGEYRKRTPFLVPTPESMARCMAHYRKKGRSGEGV